MLFVFRPCLRSWASLTSARCQGNEEPSFLRLRRLVDMQVTGYSPPSSGIGARRLLSYSLASYIHRYCGDVISRSFCRVGEISELTNSFIYIRLLRFVRLKVLYSVNVCRLVGRTAKLKSASSRPTLSPVVILLWMVILHEALYKSIRYDHTMHFQSRLVCLTRHLKTL